MSHTSDYLMSWTSNGAQIPPGLRDIVETARIEAVDRGRTVFIGVSTSGHRSYRFDSPYSPSTDIETMYKVMSDGTVIRWHDEDYHTAAMARRNS